MAPSAEQIASLVERHTVPLALWIGRRCRSPEDIVQEAFCRLAALDRLPDHPVAWLYRVCRNLAETERLTSQRRRSREQRVAATEQVEADPSDRMATNEALQAVVQLEDRLREVLTARIWGQLTFEEIADLCEISTATASRRHRDALIQLRKMLSVPCPTSNP